MKKATFSDELLDSLLPKGRETSMASLQDLFGDLKGALAERILKDEMTHHLGYKPHESAPDTNRRNGSYSKTIQGDGEDMTPSGSRRRF